MKKILIVFIMAILVSACSGPRDEQAVQKKLERTGKIKVDGKYVRSNHKKEVEVPTEANLTVEETQTQE